MQTDDGLALQGAEERKKHRKKGRRRCREKLAKRRRPHRVGGRGARTESLTEALQRLARVCER